MGTAVEGILAGVLVPALADDRKDTFLKASCSFGQTCNPVFLRYLLVLLDG